MTAAGGVKCALVEQWIYRALDRELSPELESLLEAHLDGCVACRRLADRAFENQNLLDSELDRLSGDLDDLMEGRLTSELIQGFRKSSPKDDGQQRNADDAAAGHRRRFLPLASAALILVAAGGLWRVISAAKSVAPATPARIEWTGKLEIDGRLLASGGGTGVHDLAPRERVRAPSGTEVRVDLAAGAIRIRTERGGRFTLGEVPEAPTFAIEFGEFSFDVVRAPHGFRVSTPLGEMRVVGTRFTVAHRDDPKPETRVEVLNGQVEVRRHRAGESGSGPALVVSTEESLIIDAKHITMLHSRSLRSDAPESPTPGEGGSGSVDTRAAAGPPESGPVLVPKAERPGEKTANRKRPANSRLDLPIKDDN